MGLSVYDEARLRAAGAESRSSPLAPVEIPYCEGLEIISAANVQESPALLAADAGAGGYLRLSPDVTASSTVHTTQCHLLQM